MPRSCAPHVCMNICTYIHMYMYSPTSLGMPPGYSLQRRVVQAATLCVQVQPAHPPRHAGGPVGVPRYGARGLRAPVHKVPRAGTPPP